MIGGLEHKAVEASTRTTSELDEFAAIAATYDVDRLNDRIRFALSRNTVARWQQSGKRVPLHWDHRGEASNVIGSVDPATMQEKVGLGLYVEGKLDLDDSEVACEAWRPMRDGRVSLSFGYLTVNSRKREDITDLLELDLFEISIVPSPANPHTRILEMKSIAAAERERANCAAALTNSPSRPRSAGSQFVEPRPSRVRPTPSCASRPRRSASPSHHQRDGMAARFRSRLDPAGVQLVKDLNAAYDRAEQVHRKASQPAIQVASFEC